MIEVGRELVAHEQEPQLEEEITRASFEEKRKQKSGDIARLGNECVAGVFSHTREARS